MVVQVNVEGYENFKAYMENWSGPALVIYSGTKLENGQSWCSDCVEAEPHIEKALSAAPKDLNVIHVQVGDRAFWKDPKCIFRTDPKTRLNVLPTLAIWGTQKRLEGDDCLNVELIEMLINDEDD